MEADTDQVVVEDVVGKYRVAGGTVAVGMSVATGTRVGEDMGEGEIGRVVVDTVRVVGVEEVTMVVAVVTKETEGVVTRVGVEVETIKTAVVTKTTGVTVVIRTVGVIVKVGGTSRGMIKVMVGTRTVMVVEGVGVEDEVGVGGEVEGGEDRTEL